MTTQGRCTYGANGGCLPHMCTNPQQSLTITLLRARLEYAARCVPWPKRLVLPLPLKRSKLLDILHLGDQQGLSRADIALLICPVHRKRTDKVDDFQNILEIIVT